MNDGSDQEETFEKAENMGVTIIRHGKNIGKDAAIKTALNYCQEKMPDVSGVLTADADGQHNADDIVNAANVFSQNP